MFGSSKDRSCSMMNLSSHAQSDFPLQYLDSSLHLHDTSLSGIPEDSALLPEHVESVRYLGSAMLSHFATGVGALQRPLAGLYFHAMTQSRGARPTMPRCTLTLNADGVRVSIRNDSGDSPDDTTQNDISAEIAKKRNTRNRTVGGSKQAVTSEPRVGETNGRQYQSQMIAPASTRQGQGPTSPITSSQPVLSSRQDPPPRLPLGSFSGEVLHPMSSVMFWDSLQFTTTRGADKKLRFAFEPLSGSAGSQNSRSLFVLLDTQFHRLCNVRHSPIFACVVRRSSGIRAIDVHAFLCENSVQAIRLCSELTELYSKHTDGQKNSECGSSVFGYQHFTRDTVRSAVGQFHRRPAVPRKLSAGSTPGGLSLASRRQYGSTPALNMIFSIAPPQPPLVPGSLQNEHGANRSTLSLSSTTTSSDRSSRISDVASNSGKSKGSSLESNLKASDCLRLGSAVSEQNLSIANDRQHGRVTGRKLFSNAGRDLKNSIRSGLHLSSPAQSNRSSSATDDQRLPVNERQKNKSNSLPNSERAQPQAVHGVFFLVQEDFCPVKKSPQQDRKNTSENGVAELSMPEVSVSTSDHDVIPSTERGLSEQEVEIHHRPVAHVHPQQVHKMQVVEVNIKDDLHGVQKTQSPTSPSSTLMTSSQSPIQVTSPNQISNQIRFIYYDDAEDSKPPDSLTVSRTESVNNSMEKNDSCSKNNEKNLEVSINGQHIINRNIPSRESQSPVVINDVTDNGDVVKTYGFSYVVNDVVHHKQCTAVTDNFLHLHGPVQVSVRTVIGDVHSKQERTTGHVSRRPATESLASSNQGLNKISQKSGNGQVNNLSSGDKSRNSNLHSGSHLRRKSAADVADRQRGQASNPRCLSVSNPSKDGQVQKLMNWQFRCPPPTVTSDYRTLRPDEMAVETDTVKKENQNKAEKKDAEIATELENLAFYTGSVLRRAMSQHDVNFERSLGYFP